MITNIFIIHENVIMLYKEMYDSKSIFVIENDI